MAITATSGKQALVDLINKDNNLSLKLTDLVLANPAAVDGKAASDALNTTVVVEGADQAVLPGSVTVTYTRQPVTTLLAVSNWKAPADTASTEAAVAAAVKAGLVADTIKSVPVEDGSYGVTATLLAEGDADYNADYPWKVVLDFGTHFVLNGSLTLFVAISKATLSEQVTTTDLNGFSEDDVKA